jgi:hypothetical protein
MLELAGTPPTKDRVRGLTNGAPEAEFEMRVVGSEAAARGAPEPSPITLDRCGGPFIVFEYKCTGPVDDFGAFLIMFGVLLYYPFFKIQVRAVISV